jgi:hypothetical protein
MWRKREIEEMMTQDEIIEMARQSGLVGKPTYIEGLIAFANLVAQRERDKVYAMQLELPEPKLTGKFSITMGKFKCSGCFGTWDSSEQAKNHSCKDYQ